MQRGFLTQKMGKRNSRRAALQREKNRVVKVAGSGPDWPPPKSKIRPVE